MSGRPDAGHAGVERLEARHVDDVVAVLSESFATYPVMRFVLGPEGHGGLATLVRLFTMARVLRGEPLLGAFVDGRLVAAALASFPDGPPPPPAFRTLRAEVWGRLGADVEERYGRYGEAVGEFAFDFPHVHLNMVGVRDAFRGRGLGRALIEAVQGLSRARAGSRGVTLVTETPENAAYYRRLGFREAGHARVAPELESWGFFRPDRDAG